MINVLKAALGCSILFGIQAGYLLLPVFLAGTV